MFVTLLVLFEQWLGPQPSGAISCTKGTSNFEADLLPLLEEISGERIGCYVDSQAIGKCCTTDASVASIVHKQQSIEARGFHLGFETQGTPKQGYQSVPHKGQLSSKNE